MVELVRATTEDGLHLDGVLARPAQNVPQSIHLDALVLLHGVGGNFYSGTLFDLLTVDLLDLGLPVLRVNTRGHDWVSLIATRGGTVRQGAAYERVDQCRLDVAAWAELLQRRGYSRIGLVGHSLGAVKALYAQAFQPQDTVQCVVAVSPPRLAHSAFLQGSRRAAFEKSMHEAQRHVDRGQPAKLFVARVPVPLLISAASYLDKHGPQERYNFLKYLGRVPCPMLLTFGDREVAEAAPGFAGVPQAIADLPDRPAHLDVVQVDEADHFYANVENVLAGQIAAWLTARF